MNLRNNHYIIIHVFFAAIAFGCGRYTPDSSARDMPGSLSFGEHLIDRLPRGYKIAVADINGDGKSDIIGLATDPPALVWYENPGWLKHVITSRTMNNIDLAVRDVDGDGLPDIVLASEFGMSRTDSGGEISFLKNPDDSEREWPLLAIDSEPTAHRLAWIDFAGNGAHELLAAPIMGRGAKAPLWNIPVRLLLFMPGLQNERLTWTGRLLDDSLTVVHGVCVNDFDNDGKQELLTASFEGIHLFKYAPPGGDSEWIKIRIGEGEQGNPAKRGSSEIAAGVLMTQKGKFCAAIEPWHGDKVVVYLPVENGEGLRERIVIDDSFSEGHALITSDLDGDGSDEIIAGYRGKGTSLFIYKCADGKGRIWEKIPLDEGDMATSGLTAADINGDGRMDILAIGTSTDNIKWYENTGK